MASEPRASLNAKSLKLLLGRLDPDPERAGQAYEDLRQALLGFFTWRGAPAIEERADETLDRLAAKLEQGQRVDDVRRFARGIARMVLLESWRRPETRAARVEELELERLPAPPEPEPEPLRDCLERCLTELRVGSRDLILRYYVAEGRTKIEGRRRLAEELGVSENGLRSRAQRVRDRLERCISRCLSGRMASRWPADTKM